MPDDPASLRAALSAALRARNNVQLALWCGLTKTEPACEPLSARLSNLNAAITSLRTALSEPPHAPTPAPAPRDPT